MNKSKLKYSLGLLSIVAFFCANGQRNKITPLHTFFQNNFDSTIILYPYSNWQLGPNYYIVSKKDTSICFFTYIKPFRNVKMRDYPLVIADKFYDEQWRFKSTVPDTNLYLNPIPVEYSLKKKYWDEVNACDIWNITDTSSVEKLAESFAMDASENTYFLIVNGKIKTIYFYDADAQRWMDKDVNRKKAHLTEEVFLKIFINQAIWGYCL